MYVNEISLAMNMGMNMMKTQKAKANFSASKTIAFSKWNYPTSSSLRQEPGVKKTSYPQGANVELLDDFYAQMWNKRAKWMNPANTFCKFFFIFPSSNHPSNKFAPMFINLFTMGAEKKFSIYSLHSLPTGAAEPALSLSATDSKSSIMRRWSHTSIRRLWD